MKIFATALILLICVFDAGAQIRITEYMYRAVPDGTGNRDREFFELTNTANDAVDMTGWSFDDSNRVPGAFSLSAFGIVMPGESVIITEVTPAKFREEWNLASEVKVLGNLGNPAGHNLGRSDEINIYDENNNLIDRLTYGDDTFPGTIRTDGKSGWVTADGLGANNPSEWVLSSISDFQGSWSSLTGDIASPGIHIKGGVQNPDKDIIINELMYNPASDNADEEYLELFNRGENAIDLSGWYFSDGITFTFPSGTILRAGEYLVVCRNAGLISDIYSISNVIGNYEGKLDNSGELVRLKNSEGETVDEVIYSDSIPYPVSPDGLGRSLERISPLADGKHPRNWDAAEASPNWIYVSRTGTATSDWLYLYLLGEGVCLIDDVSIVPEGGSVEHIINGGFESGSNNWSATGNHASSTVIDTESYSGSKCMKIIATSGGGSWTNSINCYTSPALITGQTYTLSFWAKYVSGNSSLYSRLSYGGIGGETILTRFCTPGQQNSMMNIDIPPFVENVQHSPSNPGSTDSVTITAKVTDNQTPSVLLWVNVAGTVNSYPMLDDGLNGDGEAGDNIYGAIIEAKPSQTIVRYWVEATDTITGRKRQQPNIKNPETAFGYFVYDDEVTSNFPLFFWQIPQANLNTLNANPQSDNYVKGILVYNGEVFDQVGFRYRGSPWTRNWPKKHWKVQFNKGHYLEGKKTINFQSNYSDKAFIREHLAYQLFRDIGHQYCETEIVRIQLNGAFQGLYTRVENPGSIWCESHGLDKNGSLYKAYDDARKQSNYEQYYSKETADETDYNDITAFLNGINDTPYNQILPFIQSNMDVYSFTGFLTGQALINGSDHPAKNYWLYKWPLENGLWEMFPWDLDLTWGRNYEINLDVLNDVIRWDNHILFGTQQYPKCDGPWNRIIDKFLSDSKLRMCYYNRVWYELKHVFTTERLYPIVEDLRTKLSTEVTLDRAKWGSYNASSTWNFDDNVNLLKNFIANRINYLWAFLTPDADGDGMPDWWEDAYSISTVPGIIPVSKSSYDADADNDGDNRNNYNEWIADTDPTDPESNFEIISLEIQEVSGEIHASIQWSVSPYRDYIVYYSDDEMGPDMVWNRASENLRGDPLGILSYQDTIPVDKQKRLYRIEVVLNPSI